MCKDFPMADEICEGFTHVNKYCCTMPISIYFIGILSVSPEERISKLG